MDDITTRWLLVDFFRYFLYVLRAVVDCPIFYVILAVLCGAAVISLFWDLVGV